MSGTDALSIVVNVVQTDELLGLRRDKLFRQYFYVCMGNPLVMDLFAITTNCSGFAAALIYKLFNVDEEQDHIVNNPNETRDLTLTQSVLTELQDACSRNNLPIPSWSPHQGSEEYTPAVARVFGMMRTRPQIAFMTHIGINDPGGGIHADGDGWIREVLHVPGMTPRKLLVGLQDFVGWGNECIHKVAAFHLHPVALDAALS